MDFRKQKNEDLHFDEVVFDSFATQNERVEMPLARRLFIFVAGAGLLIGLITLGRVFWLNVIKGQFYAVRAEGNVNKEIKIPAPRGLITDRHDVPLAENAAAFSVIFVPGESTAAPDERERGLAALLEKLASILEVEELELRERLAKADFEKRASALIAHNIPLKQVIELKALGEPAIQIQDDYVRQYQRGEVFAHIIGYTGFVETTNDIVGKIGLEAVYDELLRGQDGNFLQLRDARGNILEEKIAAQPEVGQSIKTTIDGELQEYLYDRLSQGLRVVGSRAGVGIILKPATGEVLALVSLPSYDNNLFARSGNNRERREILTSPTQPMFNRAVSGEYNPGSTIKPLVGLAALAENVVNAAATVFSQGYIEIPNPYFPDKPSRFLDWKAHGLVDLHSALAKSSNVYFYAVGGGYGPIRGLGIERLRRYWELAGLGAKSGIDLLGEQDGFLPEPEEKEKRTGQIWRIGDTYNVSIGQGDLSVTPIQLVNFIGSLANGGVINQPRLIANNEIKPIADYSKWQDGITEVAKGMKDAVSKSYGTANLLSSVPMPIAAKTGSAQIANNTKTNAFIVGFTQATKENDSIAFLILVEDAREGSLNAVPIARDVLEWYYQNRVKSL